MKSEPNPTLIGLAIGMLFGAAFNAIPATIDFETAPRSVPQFEEQGLLFVLRCSDGAMSYPGYDSRFLHMDQENCGRMNDDWPSVAGGSDIWAGSERLFDLMALDTVSPVDGRGFFAVTSSAGGQATSRTSGTLDFSGAEWRNLNWVTLTDSNGFHAHRGWDNLQVAWSQVPEPSTLALLLLAAIPLAILTRRRR
jgi:hypothetical protein